MSNTAHDLTKRLLNALDSHYNVIDMHEITEIISILEKITITKELLEATRLGKHVNELRRRAAAVASSDVAFAALARRAKLLVKRWRDLVIPNSSNSDVVATLPPAAPAPHTSTMVEKGAMQGVPGPPISPALRQTNLIHPLPVAAVTQPANYDSDSQDVILVDDEPQLPPTTSVLSSQGTKRAFPESPPNILLSPPVVLTDKKARRDKKSKKKSKNRSRAAAVVGGITIPALTSVPIPVHNGVSPMQYVHRDIVDLDLEQSRDASLTEAPDVVTVVEEPPPLVVVTPPPAKRPGRKNGCKKNAGVNFDNYSKFLRDKLPAVGVKKVKTTKELLEDIQSRAGTTLPALFLDPEPSADVKSTVPIIELPDGDSDDDITTVPVKDEKPAVPKKLNQTKLKSPSPPPAPKRRLLESPRTILARLPPITAVTDEDEQPSCGCVEGGAVYPDCPAARLAEPFAPSTVFCLHNAYIPDVNGSRDNREPKGRSWKDHPRTVYDSEREVFTNVVPRYKYLDYSEDKCVKNLSKVPLDRYPPAPALPPEEVEPFFRRHYDSAADTPFSEDAAADLEVERLHNGSPSPPPAGEPVVSNKLNIKSERADEESAKGTRKSYTYGDSILQVPLSLAELNSLLEPEPAIREADLSSALGRSALVDRELLYDRVGSPPLVEFGDIGVGAVAGLDGEPVPEPSDSATLPSFKEWHEPVSRISNGEESLCILPYVVID